MDNTKSQSGEREGLEEWLVREILMDNSERSRQDREMIRRGEFEIETRKRVTVLLDRLLSESKKECLEECIKLSDEIEQGKDTTTEEWRAFKQFRNTLRDMEKKERELKFRVFLDNKMIYIENQKGKKHSAETAHILIQNGIQEPFDNDGEDPLELVFDGSGIHLYSLWDGWDKIEIERDYILMQSTGLEDKNGKEIYEGDIVTDGQEVVVIEFDNDIGAGCAPFIEVAMSGWQCSDGSDAEVIGNIYENPELIS